MAGYRLSKDAVEDIKRLYRYGLGQFGPPQADRYLDGLFDRFDSIAETPQLYSAVEEIRTGYRRSVLAAHSIYYRERDGTVEVMRILGREDPTVVLPDI